MSSNNISIRDDEIFLKEFLKEFYLQIMRIENYTNFKIILKEWIQEFFNNNEKDTKKILKLMENHKENENWFSSLIGFFYDYGIISNDNNFNSNSNNIIINKNKSLNLYLLSINNNNNNKLISGTYQLLNIIISKYLLSL